MWNARALSSQAASIPIAEGARVSHVPRGGT